jgi:prevent-host-death family protein
MRTIAQRELRNRSGEVLREVERGEEFLVTVGGRPVAELAPYRRRRWVPRAEVAAVLRTGASDPTFFQDLAEVGGTADQLGDPWEPRG